MSLFDKIYNADIITKQEIKQYLKGKLSETEKSKFEQKLANSRFNQDAFEGYTKNNALPSKINLSVNKNFNFILSYLFVVVLTAANFIFAEKTSTVLKDEPKTAIKKEINFKPEKSNKLTVINSEPKEKSVKQKKLTIAQNNKDKRIFEYLPLIKSKTVKKLKQIDIKNNVSSTNIKLRTNFKTKYLSNLKIVDYSMLKRTNNLTKQNNDIWNVAPEFANNQEQNISANHRKSIEYTYFDFLEKGLSYFNNKNYDDAIDVFEIILSQYNNDLNAVFYMGLSYYEKHEYAKAIQFFDIAINADINVFYQESLWYKALSYKNIDKQKYRDILKTIINENGFYATRAKQKADKIK